MLPMSVVQREKYAAAIDKYTEAITLSPGIPALYVNRALCYRRRNDAEAALKDAQHALDLDPNYMKVKFKLASCCYTVSPLLWPHLRSCHLDWCASSLLFQAHFLCGWAMREKQDYAPAIKHLSKVGREQAKKDWSLAVMSGGLQCGTCWGVGLNVPSYFQTHSCWCSCLQALEAARALNDSIKDDIWRELARATYAKWQADSGARSQQREALQQALHAVLASQPPQSNVNGSLAEQLDTVFQEAAQRLDTAAEVRVHEGCKCAVQQGGLRHALVLLIHQVPSPFICPLTMEVFRDPVITPAGGWTSRSGSTRGWTHR